MEANCLLYTPGIDSYLSKWFLENNGIKPKLFYFDYNGNYTSYEIKFMKTVNRLDRVKVLDIDLQNYENIKDFYLPNRNLLMCVYAVNELLIDSYKYDKIKIWLGGTKTDNVNDNNTVFYEQCSKLLSTMHDIDIQINSPIIDLYKHEAIDKYVNSFSDKNEKAKRIKELISDTFSCYEPLMYYPVSNEVIFKDKETCNEEKIQMASEECLSCKACFRKNCELFRLGVYRPFLGNFDIIIDYKKRVKNQSDPRSILIKEYVDRVIDE